MNTLTLEAIREASARIRGKVNRTPIMTSQSLDALAQARLFFKCENLQKTGAFKARGATNAVFALSDEEAERGVVTSSSGNHAAGVARAAKLRGIPAYIVMPKNAAKTKQASVARYGGNITFCEPAVSTREAAVGELAERTGAVFIHPYDDLRVMAGQGTTGLELLEDLPDLDLILCPVGGGGQLSGVAVAAKALKPGIRIVGVEPSGADDAQRSLKAGRIIPCTNPDTIADGLRTSLGKKTFIEIQRHVDDIVTVSEESIIEAMQLIWGVLKIIVEPSGAVPFAAILERKIQVNGMRVALILSGGNLDLDRLPWQVPRQGH